MQQRRLRPGDVLDDYCPRERRVTDHAIVAMIDDDIKQTRCVSCDTEHEYKQGRVPPQRRKKASAALFNQVLDGMNRPTRPAHPADEIDPDAPSPSPEEDDATDESWPEPPPAVAPPTAVAAPPPALEPPATAASTPEPAPLSDDEFDGPVRRPLIRAQLPRLEGQPPPTRTLPDFTVRQAKNGRGNRPAGGPRHGGGRRRPNDLPGTGGPPRFGGGQRPQGQGRQSGGGGRTEGAGGGWSGNRSDRGRGGRGHGKKPR